MILFLESVAGVAGDMFAASFVDAGLVTGDELQALPKLLGLGGVSVVVSHPLKATMRTTHLNVRWEGEGWKKALTGLASAFDAKSETTSGGGFFQASPDHHAHRSHSNILNPGGGEDSGHWHAHYGALDQFLKRSRLDEHTKAFARKVFRLIAEAEAAAHGMAIGDIAFHEVGAVDSIVDVVMAAYCVGKIKPARVFATPVKLGRGMVSMEHGTHPVPPPASARLILGMPVGDIPPAITRPNVELSTPTGLAILKALEPEFVSGVPQGRVLAQGMGAGTMDLGSYPNVFRVMTLEPLARDQDIQGRQKALSYETDRIIEISCNIDDQTAERTAWLAERLLKQGALDVWTTPITGKKNRAGVVLSVLADEARWTELADWLLRKSTTFGLRHRAWDRLKLERRFEKRALPSGELVTFKIGLTTDGQVLKEKPEFDEMQAIWDKGPSLG